MAAADDAPAPVIEDWAAVRLVEARQVTALIGEEADDAPDADVAVAAYYRTLRGRGQRSDAVAYLAHALPRLELIAWAARVVEDAAATRPPRPAARHALDVALRWVGEPNDAHRRAAGEAADGVSRDAPERYLGFAVFYSGGSIAEPGHPALLPPGHAAARNAATAIGQAAFHSGDADAAFDRALDLGERVATLGMAALRR